MSRETFAVGHCFCHGWVPLPAEKESVWDGDRQETVEGYACPMFVPPEDECGFKLDSEREARVAA